MRTGDPVRGEGDTQGAEGGGSMITAVRGAWRSPVLTGANQPSQKTIPIVLQGKQKRVQERKNNHSLPSVSGMNAIHMVTIS